MPYKDETKQRQAQHESYLRNKEAVKTGARKNRQQIKEFLTVLKSDPCTDCGLTYPPYVMDFDHRDPTTKVGSIGALTSTAGLERIKMEISKCDLVCANCHRIRTYSHLEDKRT